MPLSSNSSISMSSRHDADSFIHNFYSIFKFHSKVDSSYLHKGIYVFPRLIQDRCKKRVSWDSNSGIKQNETRRKK